VTAATGAAVIVVEPSSMSVVEVPLPAAPPLPVELAPSSPATAPADPVAEAEHAAEAMVAHDRSCASPELEEELLAEAEFHEQLEEQVAAARAAEAAEQLAATGRRWSSAGSPPARSPPPRAT